MLPTGLGRLAEALFAARAAWRARYPDAGARRRAIAAALAEKGALDPLKDHSTAVRAEPAEALPFTSAFGSKKGQHFDKLSASGHGEAHRITLASPDPDDLTLRQARLLANADRVTHGADVPRAILDRARADADRIETAAPPVEAEPGLNVDVRMA
jgi:uroporphyrin-III C-methyltransferase / precorrin-2 dehydrogenase / sirohydrochlorin ferrochelatase